jgi:hypothetical protein
MLQEAQKYMKDKHFQDATRKASQASKNLSHNLTDESSKRLAEGVSGSYEKGMQQRQEASKSYSEAESLSKQATNMRAHSAAINANDNQQFFEWLAAQRSDNTTGHIGHRGAADIIARKPEEAIAWAHKYMSEQGLLPHEHLHTGPQKMKESYQAETRHQVYTPTTGSLEAVKRQLPPEFNHPLGSEGVVFDDHSAQATPENPKHLPDMAAPYSLGLAFHAEEPSAFERNLAIRGEKLREDGINALEDSNKIIGNASASLLQQGSKVEKKVKDQKGRPVTGQVIGKLGTEIRKTILGEPQQK